MPKKEKEVMRPCGHRLSEKHFTKIRTVARKMKVKEAEALRFIIEEFPTEAYKFNTY